MLLGYSQGRGVGTRSVSVIKIGDAYIPDIGGAVNRNFCLMLSLVIAPYMVQVSYDFNVNYNGVVYHIVK